MFRIGRNTFYDRKNKIPMKIPEFKRSGIGLIAEFRGILNGFPNQDHQTMHVLVILAKPRVTVLLADVGKPSMFDWMKLIPPSNVDG